MNATDVKTLKPFWEADIVRAQERLDELIDNCTHVYNGGSSAVVVDDGEAHCQVCERGVDR